MSFKWVYSVSSPTHWVACSKTEIKIKQKRITEQQQQQSEAEKVPSTDHLFPMCVIAQWIFCFSFLSYFRLCEDVYMSLQGPASGNCVLWYSLLQANPSLSPFKCFPLWHVVFICWTQESVSLICLSCSARVMFFKPGSGNFFFCVIEGYDNYPFSISTVDMFIVLNVHLPVPLLFWIMEIFSIYLLWHAL